METASEKAELPSQGATQTGHYRTIELPSGRSFIAHVPDNYDAAQPAPVVMVFHGYNSDPATIFQDTELYEANAITLFPAGIGEAWAPAPYAQTSLGEDFALVDDTLAWPGQGVIHQSEVFPQGSLRIRRRRPSLPNTRRKERDGVGLIELSVLEDGRGIAVISMKDHDHRRGLRCVIVIGYVRDEASAAGQLDRAVVAGLRCALGRKLGLFRGRFHVRGIIIRAVPRLIDVRARAQA